MSVEEDKALVLRFLKQVWEQGDLNVVDQIIAKEHVHHLTRRDIYGLNGVKQLVTRFRNFMLDVELTIDDLLADNEKVIAYFTFSGTDQGGFMDRPPSGKPVTYSGIDIFRVVQGKIVERWGIVDNASVLYQVGALT